MVLTNKVSGAAVARSTETREGAVCVVAGNPLLAGNPRPYLIAEFYGNVNGTPFTAAERGGIEMVRYRSVTNRILTDFAQYTFNC